MSTCVAVHGFPLDWNLWPIDDWPQKIAEIQAVDRQAGLGDARSASARFGAEEVQACGVRRTAELLLGRAPRISWYSLYDLPTDLGRDDAPPRGGRVELLPAFPHGPDARGRHAQAARWTIYANVRGARWASASGSTSRTTRLDDAVAWMKRLGVRHLRTGLSAGPTVSAPTRSAGSTGRWRRWRISTSPSPSASRPSISASQPHHTSAARDPQEFADFCAGMIDRYAPAVANKAVAVEARAQLSLCSIGRHRRRAGCRRSSATQAPTHDRPHRRACAAGAADRAGFRQARSLCRISPASGSATCRADGQGRETPFAADRGAGGRFGCAAESPRARTRRPAIGRSPACRCPSTGAISRRRSRAFPKELTARSLRRGLLARHPRQLPCLGHRHHRPTSARSIIGPASRSATPPPTWSSRSPRTRSISVSTGSMRSARSRAKLCDPLTIGRVIARPFIGESAGDLQAHRQPPRLRGCRRPSRRCSTASRRPAREVIGIGKISRHLRRPGRHPKSRPGNMTLSTPRSTASTRRPTAIC